mmetsp:Transcript_14067/g.39978  ORF Transcript_14067/g.39978 Transcript_14067/m.39978 type:complete len:122 (+) Transcript_14067:46-411(+)
MEVESVPIVNVEWSVTALDIEVFFAWTRMDGCHMIWIGMQDAKHERLNMSIPCPQEISGVTGTSIVGPAVELDTFGATIAEQLARKFKQVFYVSYNIPPRTPDHVVLAVQKSLFEKLKDSL